MGNRLPRKMHKRFRIIMSFFALSRFAEEQIYLYPEFSGLFGFKEMRTENVFVR